jgi:hypothetical protein
MCDTGMEGLGRFVVSVDKNLKDQRATHCGCLQPEEEVRRKGSEVGLPAEL